MCTKGSSGSGSTWAQPRFSKTLIPSVRSSLWSRNRSLRTRITSPFIAHGHGSCRWTSVETGSSPTSSETGRLGGVLGQLGDARRRSDDLEPGALCHPVDLARDRDRERQLPPPAVRAEQAHEKQ